MAYRFRPHNPMWVYELWNRRGDIVRRTDRSVTAGNWVQRIRGMELVVYDASKRLALRLDRIGDYLLLEEIAGEMGELSKSWQRLSILGAEYELQMVDEMIRNRLKRYFPIDLFVVGSTFAVIDIRPLRMATIP